VNITGYVNWGIEGMSSVINGLLALLPGSPLAVDPTGLSAVGSVMGYASYFLPIHEAVTFLGALATAIAVYYVVRIALRWLKVMAA
jgi:hypothetical protein